MGKVVWTDEALDDLVSAAEFIAEYSLENADRFIDRIDAAVRQLEMFPFIGQIVPEVREEHVRERIVGPYRVIYATHGDNCTILCVIHGSRDRLRHFNPRDFDEL